MEEDLQLVHEKHINTHQYKVFAQDIKETELLAQNLINLGVDFTAPTLVLTECFLVYLKQEDSNRILETLRNAFKSDLMILNYEMIHPSDPFGRVMLENLEVRKKFKIMIKLFKHNQIYRTEDVDSQVFMTALMKISKSKE